MRNQTLLIVALLIFSASLLFAFSSARPEKAVYEYVAIVQDDTFELLVSEQGKEQRRVKIKDEKNAYDYRVIFAEINKYEAEGWELFSNSPFMVPGATSPYKQNYFLLRRRK